MAATLSIQTVLDAATIRGAKLKTTQPSAEPDAPKAASEEKVKSPEPPPPNQRAAQQQSEKNSQLASILANNHLSRVVQLDFEMDKDTKRVIVRMVDRDSGEVIRQIPPEEVLRAAKAMADFKGLLVDQAT